MENGSDFLLRKDLMEIIEKTKPALAFLIEAPTPEFVDDVNYAEYEMWAMLRDAVRDLPGIEISPVRHGHWIWRGKDRGWYCSECGSGCLLNTESDWHNSNWCPQCGSKMDLPEECA